MAKAPAWNRGEATAVPFAVPAKPTGLTATPGRFRVLLEWDDPGDEAISGWEYNRRRLGGDYEEDWTAILNSSAATTSHTVIGLEPGVYGFKVRAFAGDHAGPESDEAAAALPQQPLPAKPIGLTAAAGDRQVMLEWHAPGDPSIASWQYRYNTESGDSGWTGMPGSDAATTAGRVAGLENGVPHTFRVRAGNSAGFGLPSDGITAVPFAALPRPTGLTATPGYAQIVLTWNDPGNPAIAKWQHVVRKRNGDRSPDLWIDIAGSGAGTTRYVVEALEEGVEYVFRVRYCTSADCLYPNYSPGSGPVFATPKAAATAAERKTVKALLASFAGHVAAGAEAAIGARFSADPAEARLVLAGHEAPLFASARGRKTANPAARGRQATAIGMDGREALRNSAFQLPLGQSQGQGLPQWSLWHRSEMRAFEGSAGPGLRYGGRARSLWFGVDVRQGENWLAGAALARSEGELEYGAGAASGKVEAVFNSMHPYVQRRFGDGGAAWITLGGGRGTIRNTTADRGVETAKAELAAVSAGFRSPLPSFGGLDLSASGTAGFARLETGGDPRTAIGSLSAAANRQTLGIEAALAEGQVSRYASLSLRREGGDGAAGAGLELASGYSAPLPVFSAHMDLRMQWLVRHSDRRYREFGLAAAVRRSAGAGGRGPSWSLAAAHRAASIRSAAGAPALDLRSGWGFVSRGAVFTPHAALGLTGAGAGRLALGLDIGPLPGPTLKLAAERRLPHASAPESRISAALLFRF